LKFSKHKTENHPYKSHRPEYIMIDKTETEKSSSSLKMEKEY